ncbi:NADPH-dependent ferric siderophore reductase, contains FAD-binding and SIP domains [Halopseudomonas sabulinigri]|uniref:NADPH-dependent ferric siderophore reductase, contains FAD-binding and SIP domains n=1 Tax=Halopseudomonas sabulinigri TaxID=472181 RepID=A0A1H1W1U1_9GAMM|nr:siderophore-interacting protein [Halopseudomonas sabulinigri]SDS90942.1 NADPH-dependent ferric siderophore reductase, contains FAD-binding and SIP domains [Halopseudomonas sabulinigri]
MKRPESRLLQVIRSAAVTPNMLRVTLGGNGMSTFPAEQDGAYIKLMFPPQGEGKGIVRTYTVRHQRELEMDVDFVLHHDGGPAATWAQHAQPGDSILIGGPGPKKPLNPEADWYLIAGDMTALPAISVNLEQLPDQARGYAVLEVISEADIQPLKVPANVELIWLVNPHPGEQPDLLVERLQPLPWLEGRPSVWAACEFSGMRALRRYFREERQVERGDLYISSYWKLGSSEDQHKVVKQQDAVAAD